MAEEFDADFQGETFLRLKELILEAGASAEGYDGEFAYHSTSRDLFLFFTQSSRKLGLVRM